MSKSNGKAGKTIPVKLYAQSAHDWADSAAGQNEIQRLRGQGGATDQILQAVVMRASGLSKMEDIGLVVDEMKRKGWMV